MADFSNIYDLLIEECVSKDVTCLYLHSLSDLNAYDELQCLFLHKVKVCECLAQKLLKQTQSVNKEVHNKLLKSFAKPENHSISLKLALQQCKEQIKNNSVCKENGSNVLRKEREQYHEIHDLKAQMQDKNIAISSNWKTTQLLHGQGSHFNGQKQQRIDITADALYNEKQENLRVWLLKFLISKKPVPEWPRSSMFKRCLITADQASVFMEMTSVHISSGLVLHQMTSDHNRSELGIHDHSNEPSSSKLVPKVVPLAVKTATSRQELELLFHHHMQC
ncbi:hypothetical protein Tco_1070206 [Tanacetum coccineum]|uniref:Uncharacterized protein n=1 Tax=Tanacetum coccineum TaxID=301880 RepID=A0ABQ5HLW6_9ASTR